MNWFIFILSDAVYAFLFSFFFFFFPSVLEAYICTFIVFECYFNNLDHLIFSDPCLDHS